MKKLENKEIKQLLKKHPHWRLLNAIFVTAVAIYFCKIFFEPNARDTVELVAFVITIAGFAYAFKMRRDVKNSHNTQIIE